MNETTDPALRSFIPVAADSHFPIQNLPYGVFRRHSGGEACVGVAIGDQILDLTFLEDKGLLNISTLGKYRLFDRGKLNPFMERGKRVWAETRAFVSRLLRADQPTLRDNAELRRQALVPMSEPQMLLPTVIGDYTDFYSSREHATNVGAMSASRSTASTATQRRAVRGILGYRASSGSCTMADPPRRLTASSPAVPSSSMPVRITPTTRGP